MSNPTWEYNLEYDEVLAVLNKRLNTCKGNAKECFSHLLETPKDLTLVAQFSVCLTELGDCWQEREDFLAEA